VGLPVRNRWFAIFVATAGAGLCVIALAGFLLTMARNNLPWAADQTIRDYYLAMGETYSQGFMVGFFLCFFLIMLSVTVTALIEHRRDPSRAVASTAILSRASREPRRAAAHGTEAGR
jgi:hypothetical protein